MKTRIEATSSNKRPNEFPRMLSIPQAAKLMGVAYSTVRRMCLENRIVHVQTSSKGRYLINYDKLLEYLNTGKQDSVG